MSIIYEALKKVEGQKASPPSESAPINPTPYIQKKEKKRSFSKKVFIPLLLLLIFSGFFLFRAYRKPESKSKIFKRVTLKKEPVKEYILEGIIYDQNTPAAVINGRVIKESDKVGIFRIDKISKDKVEMVNTENNSKVTLFLL